MTEFIMTIGLPASGKTTWAKAQEDYYWLSSDEIRKATGCSKLDVFTTMNETAKKFLSEGKNVIYDATNLWQKRRTNTLKYLKAAVPNAYFRAEVFLIPYETLKTRNAGRSLEERVPDDTMIRFVLAFDFPQMFEGWDEININKCSVHKRYRFGDCVDFDQKNPHHDLTLDKHLWKTVDLTELHHCPEFMQTAALYHDIGKVYCQTIKDGVAHYYGHEHISTYLYAMHEYTQNWYTWNEFLDILFIINYHMRPYQWTNKSYQKDLQLFGERRIELLRQFHYCDEAAH